MCNSVCIASDIYAVWPVRYGGEPHLVCTAATLNIQLSVQGSVCAVTTTPLRSHRYDPTVTTPPCEHSVVRYTTPLCDL